MRKIQAESSNMLPETASCLGTHHASVCFLWFKLSRVQAPERRETVTQDFSSLSRFLSFFIFFSAYMSFPDDTSHQV